MNAVTLRAPAKINLTLDVLARNPDGYHEIASIMQAISLADHLTVSLAPGGAGVTLEVTGPEAAGVPTDGRNLAARAVNALGASDLHIHLEKHIPSQAGLGGGSSDGAAALLAVDRLLGKQTTIEELAAIGKTLGADVPFFLAGGTAWAEGIGERVTPLSPYAQFSLVIVKPAESVPTAEAYALLDQIAGRQSAQATANWPLDRFSNDFEAVIYGCYPLIAAARDALRNAGADRVLLCGSGAAVFGATTNPQKLAKRVEAANVGRVYIAETQNEGVIFL